MKIGIYFPDYNPEAGGASTLLNTILDEIENTNANEYEFVVLYRNGKNKTSKNSKNIQYLNIDYLFGLNIITKLIRKIREVFFSYSILDKVSKKEGIDLIYFPYNPRINITTPFIFTVWDLGHRTTPQFPEVQENWKGRELTYTEMLPKAKYIITGNNQGKKEIMEYYNIPREKIKICEFPVPKFCFGKEKKPSFELKENYFFYPAQFWAHKNHICIVEAVNILKKKYNINVNVYFTGSDKGNRCNIENRIKELSLGNQIYFTGFISDEELKYMYTHAIAMVFASLMGPNNIPPIEATYLNCPVLITNIDGHKEQMKDYALFFDGSNPNDLATKMHDILTNTKLRVNLKEKEKEYAKELEKVNYFDSIMNIFKEYKEKYL